MGVVRGLGEPGEAEADGKVAEALSQPRLGSGEGGAWPSLP